MSSTLPKLKSTTRLLSKNSKMPKTKCTTALKLLKKILKLKVSALKSVRRSLTEQLLTL